MTFRTLMPENKLAEFLNEINKHIETPVTTEMLSTLFFFRDGSFAEYSDKCVYFLNNDGLSVNSQKDLNRIIEGINQMGMVQNGKPIIVKMRLSPSQKRKGEVRTKK